MVRFDFVFQILMNAGTTLVVCVLISVRTFWDPTSVAAPLASS